jgi:hypothetical protein
VCRDHVVAGRARHRRSPGVPCRGGAGKLALELHRNEFRRLRADARDLLERPEVFILDRRREFVGAQLGEHAHRRLRADARDRREQPEHLTLARIPEAVERERILPHDEGAGQRDLGADAQLKRVRRGDEHIETDAADRNDGARGADVGHRSGELRNH